MTEADLAEVISEVAEAAQERAGQLLDQVVAEIEAKKQGEVERQQTRGAKGGAKRATKAARRKAEDKGLTPPITEPEWQQAARPNGRGNIRYRPSSNLTTDALKAMVYDAIKAAGADPDLHVVYDERIGDRGLETTGKGYSFANVKPTEDNPAYEGMLKTSRNGKQYPQASFYVDFNDDGTVRVKPSDVYKKASAEAAEVQQGEPEPGEQDDDELPF